MKVLLFAFVLTIAATFTNTANAQTSADNNSTAFLTKEISLSENWIFSGDDDQNVRYIDFESIHVNLSDLILKDANGEVVLKEDVLDLPVNTIYELDMSHLPKGEYQLELRSYTGIVKKAIQLK